MKRENRYIVIKRKDLSALSQKDRNSLSDMLRKIRAKRILEGRDLPSEAGLDLDCVVVEKDWPMYEAVWRMIEDCVANDQQHNSA